MPFKVEWQDDAQSVILSESMGHWTWDEYHAAMAKIVSMMSSVPHRVDTINVSGQGSRMPSGSMFPHFSRAAKMMPANHGITIVVASTTFSKMMVGVSHKVYSGYLTLANIVFVVSINEAFAVIEDKRAAH